MSPVLLEVDRLNIQVKADKDFWPVVEDVSFKIHRGEVLGIVGESGCGKSVTCLSLLRLLGPRLSVSGGSIRFKGSNLLEMEDRDFRRLRGQQMAMIFQEPMTSLNPVFTCGEQIAEVVRLHCGNSLSKVEVQRVVIDVLKAVGLAEAEHQYAKYPHQLSGGMRQRVLIAMAIVGNPDLIIADEPTTALDVTIQAQILALLREIQKKSQSAILLITHDLGVIAEMADRVLVMYAGTVVEEGSVEALFFKNRHPYTRGLFNSIPQKTNIKTNQKRGFINKNYLIPIPGQVPSVGELHIGCRFYDRCASRLERCRTERPLPSSLETIFSCHNPLNLEETADG